MDSISGSDCLPTEDLRDRISEREEHWGNYGDNRYGFVFRDQQLLPEPIAYKGAQGFFDVPAEVLSGEVVSPPPVSKPKATSAPVQGQLL